ncbi:Threonylcarbamoyl-AMP synthase [Bienertia sinuspersici]
MRPTGSHSIIPLNPEIEAFARKQGSKRRQNKHKKKGELAEQPTKSLWEYGVLDTTADVLSSIVSPAVNAANFELKPQFTGFISSDSFAGLATECLVIHIASFLEKCDTVKINIVTDNAIRLRLFSFSLRDRAKEWLRDEGTCSLDTWEKLAKAFLVKFLGQEKTSKLRNELATF